MEAFHKFHFYLWKQFMLPSTLSLEIWVACIKNNNKQAGVHLEITRSPSNFIVFGKRVTAESTLIEAD